MAKFQYFLHSMTKKSAVKEQIITNMKTVDTQTLAENRHLSNGQFCTNTDMQQTECMYLHSQMYLDDKDEYKNNQVSKID